MSALSARGFSGFDGLDLLDILLEPLQCLPPTFHGAVVLRHIIPLRPGLEEGPKVISVCPARSTKVMVDSKASGSFLRPPCS